MTDSDEAIARNHAERLRDLASELRVSGAGFSEDTLKKASETAATALESLAEAFEEVTAE